MSLRILSFRKVFLVGLSALCAPLVHGGSYQWTGSTGPAYGDWADFENWNDGAGGIPGLTGSPLIHTDSATIDNGFVIMDLTEVGGYNLTSLSLTDSSFIQDFTLSVSGDVVNNGSAIGSDLIMAQAQFTVGGDFTNEGYAGLTGAVSATNFYNSNWAVVNNGGATLTGNFVNSNFAQITGSSSVSAAGDFDNQDAAVINLQGGSISAVGFNNTSSAAVYIQDGGVGGSRGSVYLTGDLTNSGTLNSADSTFSLVSGNLNNSGTFNALADDSLPSPAGTTITISNGTLTNSGAFTLTGGTITIGNGATPAAVGLANTDGTFNVGNDYTAYVGQTAPAPLYGAITIANGDVQNSGGTINITGASMTVSNGNFYNSGSAVLNVSDDIAAPTSLGLVRGSLSITNGNLIVTGGEVSVTESRLTAETITNENSATFTAQDDSSLAQPVGSSISAVNVSNLDSGMLTVIGSTLQVSNSIQNVGNAGGSNPTNATITIENDDLPSINGTGSAAYGSVQAANVYNNTGAAIQIIGGDLYVTSNLDNNGATITVANNASLDTGTLYANNFTNRGGSTLSVTGGYVFAGFVGGTFSNSDTSAVNIQNGGVFFSEGGQFTNGLTQSDSAKVSIDASSQLILSAGGLFQTGSGSSIKVYGSIDPEYVFGTGYVLPTITLGNAGDPTGSGGTLGGSGTIGYPNAHVSVVNNAGIVDPGDPQILTINGSYTQGANGVLEFNVDGAGGAGVGFDELLVGGNVTLGGTLDIILGNGYTLNGALPLLVYSGTLAGEFATVEINGTPTSLYGDGLGFTQYSPAATPEPSSLFALALPVLALLRRRPRKR